MSVTGGLSQSLRQLRDRRHTLRGDDGNRGGIRTNNNANCKGCITCKLAVQLMKDIAREVKDTRQEDEASRELEWARLRRNLLLTRHPTNWAGATLLQGTHPERSHEELQREGPFWSNHGTTPGVHRRSKYGSDLHDREQSEARSERRIPEGDTRPKLVPSVMLSLTSAGAEAIMNLAEQVENIDGANPAQRREIALDLVSQAIAHAAFAARRDAPRMGVLIIKLQAAVRGWLARRLARALLLRGGCRREMDDTGSGTWQYVWSTVIPASEGIRSRHAGGQELYRSHYAPVLLKGELLPSPRAARRRIETEAKRGETKLKRANALLQEQREALQTRKQHEEVLASLAEVLKLIERAMVSLQNAAAVLWGSDRNAPSISVRILHPRGGGIGDGARRSVVQDVVTAWKVKHYQIREQAAALRARARANSKGVSPRRKSTDRGPPSGTGADCRERAGEATDVTDASPSASATNENLAAFEQRLLADSLHQNASSAVASLLLRKGAVLAVREAAQLGRNRGAWHNFDTSPVGLAIQAMPPDLDASLRFVALAHHGRLVAVSQASPFVFWESLVAGGEVGICLESILEPFLHNSDLLEMMYDASTSERSGRWSMPSLNTSGTPEEDGEDGSRDRQSGLVGFRSHFSMRGCRKVDAPAAARRDDTVKLGFDSVAFEMFLVHGKDEARREHTRNARDRDAGLSAGHAEVQEDANASPQLGSLFRPRAWVTHVVPFSLEDGLPRELGPLLFDPVVDSAVLSGKAPVARQGEYAPSQSLAVEPKKGGRETDATVGDDPDEGHADGEYGLPWSRQHDPLGSGEVLSHIHRYRKTCHRGEYTGSVEVRVRGKALDGVGLARAGFPKDLYALAVGRDAADLAGKTSPAFGEKGEISGGLSHTSRRRVKGS